jgi:hypothetical protein
MPVPWVAPSTSASRFADPALVYRRRERTTPLAPDDPTLSTSMACFTDPALIYHHREQATPSALDSLSAHTKPPVYHSVAIHRDLEHVHPMVTHRTTSVLSRVDRLILAANMAATLSDTSLVPSPIRASLADPTGITLWRSTRPC